MLKISVNLCSLLCFELYELILMWTLKQINKIVVHFLLSLCLSEMDILPYRNLLLRILYKDKSQWV